MRSLIGFALASPLRLVEATIAVLVRHRNIALLAFGIGASGQVLALNDAAFVAQDVPATMALGHSYPVTVTMQNTGDTTWASGTQYRLGVQDPQDNDTWGAARVELPNSVPPGTSVTFSFTVTAPSTFGIYNFQWRMVQDGIEWFGSPSANVAIRDGVNGAAFVSQTVPAVMVPGQSYPVALTMQNVGNTTWTPGSLYRLGSQNPRDNSTWGVVRIDLDAPVEPGGNTTFSFNVVAPARVGVYNFQWMMVEDNVEWFGDSSPNVLVTDGLNSASFVSQSIPNVMVPGQTYPVSVTMTNTGNTTWTATELYRLGTQNERDNMLWGLRRVELPTDIPPGASATFSFNVTAPGAVGIYNFQWQMVQDTVAWFGDLTPNVSVKDGLNDATFVTQSIPATMVAGQSYPITVAMQNVGTTTWTSESLYRLGAQNPQDNQTWSRIRVELPSAVALGASTTFAFTVTAPTTPGAYNLQWRMVKENVEWFGGYTDNAVVTVQAAPPNTGSLTVTLDGVLDGDTLYEGAGVDLVASGTSDAGSVVSLGIAIDGVIVAQAQDVNHLLYGWSGVPLGSHLVAATARDSFGTSSTVTKTVNVVVHPLDVPFRAVLDSFKAAAVSGSTPAVMAHFSKSAQATYGPVVNALMPFLPQIVSEWSSPRRMDLSTDSAEFAITRSYNGVKKVYFITFVRDEAGNWVIESM